MHADADVWNGIREEPTTSMYATMLRSHSMLRRIRNAAYNLLPHLSKKSQILLALFLSDIRYN